MIYEDSKIALVGYTRLLDTQQLKLKLCLKGLLSETFKNAKVTPLTDILFLSVHCLSYSLSL